MWVLNKFGILKHFELWIFRLRMLNLYIHAFLQVIDNTFDKFINHGALESAEIHSSKLDILL